MSHRAPVVRRGEINKNTHQYFRPCREATLLFITHRHTQNKSFCILLLSSNGTVKIILFLVDSVLKRTIFKSKTKNKKATTFFFQIKILALKNYFNLKKKMLSTTKLVSFLFCDVQRLLLRYNQ